jgi:hypothetical protein
MARDPIPPLPSLRREDPLTQYGRRKNFRRAPRDEDRGGVSLLGGPARDTQPQKLTPAEAKALVVGPSKGVSSRDGVRYATVGDLEDAGFTVRRDPQEENWNWQHVLVLFKDELSWSDEIQERFEACFGEARFGDQE